MFERLQKLLDRIESRIALWSIVRGTGIVSVGALTGWLSQGVAWIDQFGAFGWWMAGLIGALFAAVIMLVAAWVRLKWITASAVRSWNERATDSVNPINPEFRSQRINLLSLVSPIDETISGKSFFDCELIGPINLVILGETNITNCQFAAHDIVLLRPDARVNNAYVLGNCELYRCRLHMVTLYIHPSYVYENFLQGNWVTRPPTVESASQGRAAPAKESQP